MNRYVRKNKNTPTKTNLSSTQVLKTFHALLDGDYSMSELIEKLNENEHEPVFNSSVISKYINTCRYCGIKIPKINNKYYVSSIPFGLNISEKESDLIKYLINHTENIVSQNMKNKFGKICQTISKYSNREIERIKDIPVDKIRQMFEQAINDERKVLLILKDHTQLECIPRSILEHNKNLYFHINHQDTEKNITLSRIAAIEILKDRFFRIKEDGAIIYKLTGNLAKNYTLRENEKIFTSNLPEYQTVVNYNENTPILLLRLLKYGELCELKTPKHIREEFKNMIDETLANYGE